MHIPAGAVCWKDVLWEPVRERWISTKVTGIDENMRKFTALLVRLTWSEWEMRVGIGQPNAGFRSALPWPSSATAELSGVLSVNSVRVKPVLHMLLYLWLWLRRDRPSFAFTSVLQYSTTQRHVIFTWASRSFFALIGMSEMCRLWYWKGSNFLAANMHICHGGDVFGIGG